MQIQFENENTELSPSWNGRSSRNSLYLSHPHSESKKQKQLESTNAMASHILIIPCGLIFDLLYNLKNINSERALIIHSSLLQMFF